MLEGKIEAKLVRYCRKVGVLCYKFSSPARRGVPDRILVFPGGRVVFLELKANGAKPTPLQVREMKILAAQNAGVYWFDNYAECERLVDAILEVPGFQLPVSNRDYLAYV